MPVIAGKSGTGKTNLLWAVARRMQMLRPEWRIVAIDLPTLWTGTMFEAEREWLFALILDEARKSDEIALAVEMLGLAAFGLCPAPVACPRPRTADRGDDALHNSTRRFRSAPLARRA